MYYLNPEQTKITYVRPAYKKRQKKNKLKTTDPSQFYHLSQKFMKSLFNSL